MRKATGQKDPIIQLLRELQTEEGRKRRDRFFVEGEEIVRRAFDFGGRVDALILTDRFAGSPGARELIEKAQAGQVEVHCASEGLIGKILEAKPTPACIAIMRRKITPLGDMLASENPLVLMVESCENADNLGMLLRSTDAAGVDGVILTADTTDPFARRVVRGSRGAVFTVPLCIRRDTSGVIEEAKRRGLQIIATSANADMAHNRVDYTKPTIIIVGNEHVGVSPATRELSDAVVRIPMRGRVNSLNIAVATSVVLYEAVRQRSAG